MYLACKEAEDRLSKKNLSSTVKIVAPRGDTALAEFCGTNLLSYSAPLSDESDLLKRYLLAAQEERADAVIRITADCWQSNPALIVEIAEMLIEQKADYASNTIHRSFMEGLDMQGCSKRALEWFDENQKEKREHPFVFFDENKMIRDEFEKAGMKYAELLNPRNPWCIHTSIDTLEDLELARGLYEQNEATRRLMATTNKKLSSPGGNGDQFEKTESVR